MLFFDAKRRSTLSELSNILDTLKGVVSTNCMYVVVCAKCEAAADREVSEEEGVQFAKSLNAMYFEYSAVTMTQHDTIQLFDSVLESLVTHIDSLTVRPQVTPLTINNNNNTNTATNNNNSNMSRFATMGCIMMTLRTMFVCTTCVTAPTTTSTTTPSTSTSPTTARSVKRYIARECPCFDCGKLPAVLRARQSAAASLRVVH